MGSCSRSDSESSSWVSQGDCLNQAVPGDILEFDRGSFSHFALYLGNDMLMDIDTGGRKTATTAKIHRRTFQDVRRSSSRVTINNMENEAQSEYNLASLPVEIIIENAKRDEKQGNVSYNILGQNCEYYATKWRYGRGFSLQADDPLLNTFGGYVAFIGWSSLLGGLVGTILMKILGR